jgi:hypothetical protein
VKDPNKEIFNAFFTFLRNAAYGSCIESYPCLLPFLSLIPNKVIHEAGRRMQGRKKEVDSPRDGIGREREKAGGRGKEQRRGRTKKRGGERGEGKKEVESRRFGKLICPVQNEEIFGFLFWQHVEGIPIGKYFQGS